MTKHITVAVVGAGLAGQAHMFGYRNATMHPDLAGVDIRLGAVVDFNEDLARSAAARYGFAAATTNLDAVLGDPAIDAVSLALPNFAYAEGIPKLIAAGKHVLAEKPLGRQPGGTSSLKSGRSFDSALPPRTWPTHRFDSILGGGRTAGAGGQAGELGGFSSLPGDELSPAHRCNGT